VANCRDQATFSIARGSNQGKKFAVPVYSLIHEWGNPWSPSVCRGHFSSGSGRSWIELGEI